MKNSVYLLASLFILFTAISACKKETSCEGCIPKNKPPVAVAGNDITISLPLDSILLDGSMSTDPDGSITAWQWATLSGPSNVLIRASNAAQTKVAALTQGTYNFELQVTDNEGAVDTDTVKVTVTNATQVNHPPIADAGVDQVIQWPISTAILNGANSHDPDNNITGFAWSKISGPSSFTFTNANIAVTPIADLVAGTYLFKLRVTDAGGFYDEDTVQVQVVLPQGSADVYFFFRDSSGSLDAENIIAIESFNPRIVLAKITIAGYPDALIEGVWALNYTPKCPITSNFVGLTAYGSFIGLPPGTYSWTAQSVTTHLVGPPVPVGFLSYWSIPHYASGTLTVPPGADCIIKEIDF